MSDIEPRQTPSAEERQLQVPDPEVFPRAERRQFTGQYKLRILEEVEGARNVDRWVRSDKSGERHLEKAARAEVIAGADGKNRHHPRRADLARQIQYKGSLTHPADAWRRGEYATIVRVAVRLPELVLQEDPDLLTY